MTAIDPDRDLVSGPGSGAEAIKIGGGFRASLVSFAYLAIPIVIILLLWELVARLSGMPAALLPPISAIFAALVRLTAQGLLIHDILASLARLFVSVAIGSVAGTVVGVLMGYFPIWEKALSGPLNFLLAIPGTAMFPLSMIWFGLTEMAIISILIYEVALTVTLNTWAGVKAVDNSLIRAGRAFGASGPALFWRVLIPAALPSIITGYRQAFSRCWRILIVAEMLVSVGAGLGYRIYWGREYFNSDVVYGGLLVVGIIGLLIERVLLRSLEVATIERWGTVRE
ncbi:ABC transporter permease [Bosea sp. 117]|uniref:ABC transporter permease n=1 Tax=Bosea sp. 117 TaxID=1125973 RepID=UPI0004947B13|nr:ABC transporter permease [Bosea sp. 117]